MTCPSNVYNLSNPSSYILRINTGVIPCFAQSNSSTGVPWVVDRVNRIDMSDGLIIGVTGGIVRFDERIYGRFTKVFCPVQFVYRSALGG